MIESKGIGYEEPRGYFSLDREIEPSYILIQLGSNDPWRWPGEGKERPGFKTIGMVTFDAWGKQQNAVVEHEAVNQLQTELQVWRDKEQAGWPMPQRPDEYVMSIFISKYIATFPDIGVIETRRKYPQHLPLPNGAACLCCTELRPNSDLTDVPGEWMKMLGADVNMAYGDWLQGQLTNSGD